MNIYFAQTSARMVELLREVSGSGMIIQPSEGDLANPEFRPYLDRYMPGRGVDVEYKSRLFRLAHDLAVSSFGMRAGDLRSTGTAAIPTATGLISCAPTTSKTLLTG